MKRIVASLIVLAATSSAIAYDFDGDMYIVGSGGTLGINQTQIQVTNNNALNGLTTKVSSETFTLKNLHSTQTSESSGFKLQLGYEFSPNFAVEAGYVDLGKTTYAANYATTRSGTVTSWFGILNYKTAGPDGTVTRSNRNTGWTIAGVGIYPLNDTFSLFAKLGMIAAKVKTSTSGNGTFSAMSDTSDSKVQPFYGIGATFYPNRDRDLGVRVEYEKFSKIGDSNTTGSTDIRLMTMGVSSKF